MRQVARWFLLIMLVQFLPTGGQFTQQGVRITSASAATRSQEQTFEEPQLPPLIQPPDDPKLPVLTAELAANPETVVVRTTTTVSMTVVNHAGYAAHAVEIAIALPDGVKLATAQKPVLTALPPRPTAQLDPAPAPLANPPLPDVAVSSAIPSIPASDVTVLGGQEMARDVPVDRDEPRAPGESPKSVSVLGPDRSQERPTPVSIDPPLGLLPLKAPTIVPGRDPVWVLDEIPAQSRVVVEATVEVATLPADGALVIVGTITAAEIREPIIVPGGVLVVADQESVAETVFVAGQDATLRSQDGWVTVTFPADAKKDSLTIRSMRLRDVAHDPAIVGRVIPPTHVFGQRALDPFVLTATDQRGADVATFDTPVTLAVRYSEAQLRARGLVEDRLTLAFFNETEQRWEPVETTIDQQTHTAQAQVTHFSAWTLADGSAPSSLYVPSLQGFQVSGFTGAASYAVPMETPKGAAGHGPTLSLSYSSGAQDGSGGWRPKSQAGWVGRGWSLNAGGSVARVQNVVGSAWDHFTFSFGGKSYDIVRGTQFQGPSGDLYEPYWTWLAVEEGDFLKVRASPPPSGSPSGTPFTWVVWTGDGTRYEFTQPLQAADNGSVWVAQWLLTRSVDPSGNRIEYVYNTQPYQHGPYILQPTYYLQEIRWGYDTMGNDTWGHPYASGTNRYRVLFTVADRNGSNSYTAGVDTQWEAPVGYSATTPHELWRLDMVTIQSRQGGSYETISEYRLTYAAAAQSVRSDNAAGQRQLTLTSVQRFDKFGWQNGSSSAGRLPATTFTYGTAVGSWPYYDPAWNRLVTVQNGQGGKITLSYANVFEGTGLTGDYENYKRVTQVLREDTSGQTYSRSYLTTYEYTGAALNTRQAQAGGFSTSAKAWYARYVPGGQDNNGWQLARQEFKEFRGHARVTVREYDGPTIDPAKLLRATKTLYFQGTARWFYTDDDTDTSATGCTPVLVTVNGQQDVDPTDPCWLNMFKSELWKGRPHKVLVYNSAGALMQETAYVYDYSGILSFYGLNQLLYMPAGLWPAFTPTRIERVGYAEGGANPGYGSTTAYCYSSGWEQANRQSGNRTHVVSYHQLLNLPQHNTIAGFATLDPAVNLTNCDSPTGTAPLRIVRTAYAYKEIDASTAQTPIAGIYYTNRPLQQATFGSSASQLLSFTEFFYDSQLNTYGGMDTLGRLTLQRAYSSTSGSTLPSQDVGYGYDVWGNRTTATQYTAWGSRTYPSYSSPSGGNTTTTEYDATFHAYPVKQINPLTPAHVERATYDFRMGTLTKVGGPNVADDATFATTNCTATANIQEVTCATYDAFGRLASIVRPGDTLSAPTTTMTYYDSALPFRYTVQQRGTSASGDYLFETLQYYDGLGRKIQAKQESIGYGSGMVVHDTRYDALGRVVSTSQPRIDTSGTTWSAYVPQPIATTALYRETKTTYDALGRPLVVVAPNGSTTSYGRWISGNGLATNTYDAKNHLTVHETDGLGRLRNVWEYQGNAGSEGAHTLYATTTYWYDALDRLVTASDAANNTTNIYYNPLGWKTTMQDPDMGTWNYYYDARGNLVTQQDARSASISFGYDALNRLQWRSTFQGTAYTDAFNSANSSAWGSSGNQTAPINESGNNVWRSIGTGTNFSSGMWRTSASLKDGRAMSIRFKLDSQTTDAHFMLEATDTTYRRFSVRAGNGYLYGQYTNDGVNYTNAGTILSNVQLNTWYVLRFQVDDRGGFLAEVYQENSPLIRGSYRAPMVAGKTWTFKHLLLANTTYLDDYREYGIGDVTYGYDNGVNGKGRRTSACSDWVGSYCGTWQDWYYDQRGRVSQTGLFIDGLTYIVAKSYDSADRTTAQTFTRGSVSSETVTSTYDAAGREVSLCTNLGGCYASSATYNALNQPVQRVVGSGSGAMTTNWTYSDVVPFNDPTMKLASIVVSASGGGGVVNQSYAYDAVGNIMTINDVWMGQTLSFTYDHRDRLLTGATSGSATGAFTQSYAYNTIGNITNKGGVGTYTYPSAGQPRPHAPTVVGGNTYSYDANGNLLSGSGRVLGWTPDNRPLSVTSGGVTEWYRYDGDGNRIQRTRAGAATFFAHGVWEQDTSTTRTSYGFGGQTIAIREGTSTVSYLHGDHLGSASAATNSSGVLTSWQRFDPWGKVRASANTMPTKRNFTGQYLDDTGLLYYNARYYDPGIGRFVSADTIAPNTTDPQQLNRYTYVLNNPLKYTDSSGHCAEKDDECVAAHAEAVETLGFIPTGLIDWSTGRLQRLLKWLGAGVNFLNGTESWTAANLGDAVEALDRVETFLGDNTTRLLGLDKGSLGFVKMTSTSPAGRVYGEINGIAMWLPDSSSEFAIETMIHELGHIVDWNLGGGKGDYSLTSPEWANAHKDKGNAVRRYSLTDPREDFADTFTWMVEQGNYSKKERDPSPDRQAALAVAVWR